MPVLHTSVESPRYTAVTVSKAKKKGNVMATRAVVNQRRERKDNGTTELTKGQAKQKNIEGFFIRRNMLMKTRRELTILTVNLA